jgi:hypothetical protein
VKAILVTSFPPRRKVDGDGPCWKDLADITTATHRKYCERWGLAYFADCSDTSVNLQSVWVDEEKKGSAPLRTMIKFPIMEHFLREENCNAKYDWVVWLDADCLVTNYEISPMTWMGAGMGETDCSGDLVLASDINGLHPTVIMARNTPNIRSLITACRDGGTRMFVQHVWSDIMALRFYLATPPYSHLPMYFSAKELCAMTPGLYDIPADVRSLYEWTPKSWTLHLSALDLKTRIEIASKYVAELKLL